jgi:hypothetical protein
MCGEHGLVVAQNYHFSVAKHIAGGTHSLYRDGHFHAPSYAQHVIPAIIAACDRSKRFTTAGAGTAKRRVQKTPVGKFPAGSCKNHPASTTHDTEGCFKSKKGRH